MVDSFASIGDPVSLQEHTDVILEGLPQEFGFVISVIESKFENSLVDEVEALLLAHELRLNKFCKKELSESSSINLTQSSAPSSSQSTDPPQGQVHLSHTQDPNQFSGFRGSGHGRGGRFGRGRGDGCSNIQCQVCYKYGHTADVCYNLFNQNYQPPSYLQYQGYQPIYQNFQANSQTINLGLLRFKQVHHKSILISKVFLVLVPLPIGTINRNIFAHLRISFLIICLKQVPWSLTLHLMPHSSGILILVLHFM